MLRSIEYIRIRVTTVTMTDTEFEPYAQSKTIFRFEEDRTRFEAMLATDTITEIEVGSGKGLFLRSAAAANPSVQFIGLEIAAKYAKLASSKLQAAGMTNADCFCADAVRVIDEVVPAQRLQAVHVYFPDPWWKARHKKRRVVNPRLVEAANRALKPGGSFHFWTDVLDYFESASEMIAGTMPTWAGPILVEERNASDDMDYHTHFERRTRRNGMPVYRTRYDKPAS
jgi:tRNA (guanine-N7-)-methyltransferase